MTGYAAGFEPAMRLALAEAVAAAQEMTGTGHSDVPVGAVILDEAGTILARAHNRREADRDPTAHAEIIAIRQAARAVGSWRLTGLTLVVTLEPCTMCAGAVTLARLGRLVYGAEDPKHRKPRWRRRARRRCSAATGAAPGRRRPRRRAPPGRAS